MLSCTTVVHVNLNCLVKPLTDYANIPILVFEVFKIQLFSTGSNVGIYSGSELKQNSSKTFTFTADLLCKT